jgi:hypothetical protein
MSKGQLGIGFVVFAAVAILIGIALFSGAVAPEIGKMTKTYNAVNTSFVMPFYGAITDLTPCGQRAITYEIVNLTGEVVKNYTVTQAAGSDGYLSARILAQNATYAGRMVNVSCNYEMKGYIPESSSRGMAVLIAIGACLLIAVAALPNLRNGVKDLLGM